MRVFLARHPVQFTASAVMLFVMLDIAGAFNWFFGAILDLLRP